jgi:putative hydrolase of the HAD superfamily
MLGQMQTLGLLEFFDGVTFSSEVGVRKPHPAIYRDALSKVGAEPEQTVFVGDRLREDIEGPKAMGMRAVMTLEWRQENNAGPADFVINRLGELPPIVARLQPGQPASGTYN